MAGLEKRDGIKNETGDEMKNKLSLKEILDPIESKEISERGVWMLLDEVIYYGGNERIVNERKGDIGRFGTQNTDCCGSALSAHEMAVVTYDRGSMHEPELRVRGYKCSEAQRNKAVTVSNMRFISKVILKIRQIFIILVPIERGGVC